MNYYNVTFPHHSLTHSVAPLTHLLAPLASLMRSAPLLASKLFVDYIQSQPIVQWLN